MAKQPILVANRLCYTIPMLEFPYGISDFEQIRRDGLFYVDRTQFIPIIENAGRQLLFLRPSRFGNGLLLTMLENDYAAEQADRFERYFGDLAIGENPTPLHYRYLTWFTRPNCWLLGHD